MGPHVSFEIYSLPRGEFTLSAIERLFFRVCQQVSCELTNLLAGVVALCAVERLFTWMNQQMFLEITSWCAGVATMSAPERLFTRMNQHVALELTCSSAGIVALPAVERFFCVFPHALLQGCVFCAGVAALATPVRLLYIMFTSFEIFCHFWFSNLHVLLQRQGWRRTEVNTTFAKKGTWLESESDDNVILWESNYLVEPELMIIFASKYQNYKMMKNNEYDEKYDQKIKYYVEIIARYWPI